MSKFDNIGLINQDSAIENEIASGDITIRGGDYSGSGDGGDIVLEAGDGSSTGGAAGAVFIRPGYGANPPTIPTVSGVPQPAEFWFVDGDSTPGYVGLKAPDAVSDGNTGDGVDTVWTLPEGDGTNGQMMVTDGAGVLSWASNAAGVALDDVIAADGAATIGNGNNQIRWNWTLDSDGQRGLFLGEGADGTNGAGDMNLLFIQTNSESSTTDPFAVFQGPNQMIKCFAGGALNLSGGDASGSPGNVSVQTGTATATDQNGGNIFIRTGNGNGTGDGGYIELRPGLAPGAGTDGYINVASLSGVTPEVRWEEDAANGNEYLGLKAPDAVTQSNVFELKPKILSVTGTSATIDETDDVVLVDPVTAAGNVTLTLHPAANERHRYLNIKITTQSASYTVTVDGNGAETIDGALTYVFPVNSQWSNLTLINDGSAWYIL